MLFVIAWPEGNVAHGRKTQVIGPVGDVVL